VGAPVDTESVVVSLLRSRARWRLAWLLRVVPTRLVLASTFYGRVLGSSNPVACRARRSVSVAGVSAGLGRTRR
jgi:hypothetical protein